MGRRTCTAHPAGPITLVPAGGTANPSFVAGIADGDRGSDDDASPRNVLRAFYVAPSYDLKDEEHLLDSLLTTRIGDEYYPGTTTQSENWPGLAPGGTGMNNAISPRYFDVSGFADLDPKPPVIWIRGSDGLIVSDTSMLDLGHLGALGAVPGWPGEDIYPAQAMVGQMRAVLDRYAVGGGRYEEILLDGVGHSPHLEAPDRFLEVLMEAIRTHD